MNEIIIGLVAAVVVVGVYLLLRIIAKAFSR